MRPGERSTMAVMISVILAVMTVRPLTEDRQFLVLSWLLIIFIGGASMVARRARMGSGAVLGVQLAILALASVALSGSLSGRDETSFAPWYQRYQELWSSGVEHMRTQGSPMEPQAGVTLIFVTAIGLIMIMTDLLVSGVHRPAWAIVPPVTLFLVPALGLQIDTGMANFVLIAVGYLLILTAEGLNATGRWSRGLSRDSADGFGSATPVVWRAAGYLAVPAIAAALLGGIVVPTLSIPGVGLGNGPGGNGPLQLTDPTLDLRRNLNQPDDRTVLEYQTDAPEGQYLRMATLPKLSSSGWGNVSIRLSSSNTLGPVPGIGNKPVESHTTSIRVLDFGSQYLPLPYAPRSFDAPGDWRYDANSLIVVNSDNRAQDLRRISYTVDSADVTPDRKELARALAGTPTDASVTAEIPRDLPDSISRLAQKVTAEADTPADKAAAIQAYLRSSTFTYSTERLPGNGYQALENFLLRDQQGYCEQFASSMAIMARVAGIPSRVSVGFLPGDRDGATWKVSIRDMHAWPELYFTGLGWVRYEPTPATLTGSAPAWTVPSQNNPTEQPSEAPSAQPSAAGPSEVAPTPAPSQVPTANDSSLGSQVVAAALPVGIGLLVLFALAAPATIRVRRRTHRFHAADLPTDQVEAAWAEIRDTVVDFGGRWPNGSPRAIGERIGERLEDPEATSMGRVATLVEQSRYARTLSFDQDGSRLADLTEDIRRGIAAPETGWRRALAFAFPRSVFRRR